jgi:Cu/Ag efflux protein CusF
VTQEKAKFGEQAVNKIIETILARLVNAERLQVRVRAKLKQLARGEIDGLTIELFGLLLRPDLRVAEFQFDIGHAAVNIRSAMRRKIELLHPSQGSLRLVIHQEQFTNALQAELSRLFNGQQREIQFQQVNCEIETRAIRFHFNWLNAEEIESGTYITTPQIQAETQTIVLEQYRIEGKEPPAEFVEATIALVKRILSLSEIANRGTTFYVQQIDIAAGKITVQAAAQIDQFPSG